MLGMIARRYVNRFHFMRSPRLTLLSVKSRYCLREMQRQSGPHLDAVDQQHISCLVQITLEDRLYFDGCARYGKSKPSAGDGVKLSDYLIANSVIVSEVKGEIHPVGRKLVYGGVLGVHQSFAQA